MSTRRPECSDSRTLSEQGVAAGPSNLAEDLRTDPHVDAHHMLIEVPRVDSPDPMLVVGNPVKMSRLAEGPIRSFPRPGEHTEEVLSETLGHGTEELADLRKAGAI